MPGTVSRELWLGAVRRLGDAPPAADGVDAVEHRATVGTSGALSWGAGGAPNGLARDLRPDEHRGLTWTTAPLDEPLSIIGVPEAVLHLTATMPVATCVVRLSEVDAATGASSLVATGVRNLTHRLSDTDPSPMPTRGLATEEVRIPLRTSGYRFTPGNRIRLTVLTSYWPVLWPSPMPGELRVHHRPGDPVAARAPGPSRRRPDAPGRRRSASSRRPAPGRRGRRRTSPSGGSRRTCCGAPSR